MVKKKVTILKKLSSRIPHKKKPQSKVTLHIQSTKAPSILADPNRFFKDEMEEAEHALFFR